MKRLWILLFVTFSTAAFGSECELDNEYLQAMPDVEVTFARADNEPLTITARLADNNQTRAAGFQRVCKSVIAEQPILFLFQRERKPRFHMHNVVAPIEITFIRADGTLDSSHLMQPYSILLRDKPTYGSQGLVIAALETRPGFLNDHGIDAATKITWKTKPQ